MLQSSLRADDALVDSRSGDQPIAVVVARLSNDSFFQMLIGDDRLNLDKSTTCMHYISVLVLILLTIRADDRHRAYYTYTTSSVRLEVRD